MGYQTPNIDRLADQGMLKHVLGLDFAAEYLFVPAQAFTAEFLATFKDFPPRMKAASFNLDQVIEKLQPPTGLK